MMPSAARTSGALDSILPGTADLLTQGGDARIALDPVSGANRYGCRPIPDPELFDFASATASVISSGAFGAADLLRARLAEALQHASPSVVYADAIARLRHDLLQLCGLTHTESQPQIWFAPSGTDLHRLAAERMLARSSKPLRVITVEENETGSGVLRALHSTDRAPETATVTLRQPDGTPRAEDAVDADFCTLTQQALAEGYQVLLIQTDISKSGLIAPSYACSSDLKRTYGAQLEVMIDACQFRLAPDTLRACLARGYSIALTGSKFLGGPSFSGVLLLPSSDNDAASAQPDATPNFGLVLRWEAALHELRAFRNVPETVVVELLQRFAQAAQHRLNNDPAFSPVATPPLQRSVLGLAPNWDCVPTVFPFLLRRPANGGWQVLNRAALRRTYLALPSDTLSPPRGQLAQPVHFGTEYADDISALRLCVSARHIATAYAAGEPGIDELIARAMQLLDKTAALAAQTA